MNKLLPIILAICGLVRVIDYIRYEHRVKNLFFSIIFLLPGCADEYLEGKLKKDDLEALKKLNEIATEAIVLYPDYRTTMEIPSFLVLNESTNKTGLLINVKNPLPKGSTKSDFQLLDEIPTYLNNYLLAELDDHIPNPSFFTDNFPVGNMSIFALKQKPREFFTFYDNFKDAGNNWIQLAFIHELFHIHQVNNWTSPPKGFQAFNEFPLTESIIAHQLMLWDLIDACYQSDAIDHEVLVKKISAVLQKLMELDPTPNDVIENHGGFQMWLEGSARYIEHFAAEASIYQNISMDPSHGWKDYLNIIEDGQLVRSIFAVRIWYHVGAGVIKLLAKHDNLTFTKLKNGLTPIELVNSKANLTNEEQDSILNEMYDEVNFSQYLEKANYILSLL